MAATSMSVRDAGGNLRDVAQEDNSGIRTPRSVPEVSGAAVSASNPLPVGGSTLGLPADAEATGDGSIIGLLKRIRSLLGGTLAVSGSAAVGAAPTLPPLSISGVDAGGLKRHVLTDATGALVTAKPLLTESLAVTAIVAAATAVSVIPANANRKTLCLINTGAGDAYFGFASMVNAATGWPLYASGGGFTWALGEAPAGAIYVFSTAGTTIVAKEGV